jgi:DNA-binding NtrC family response regulator
VVLIIVGEQNTEAALEAMRLGAFDYLTKPLNPRHAEVAVERAMRHRKLLEETQRYKEQLELLLGSEQLSLIVLRTTIQSRSCQIGRFLKTD